jgi:hypothetical protein
VVYEFKRRMWAALDATYYWGGQTKVDGVDQPTLQRSSRVGATFALPLGKRDSLKLAFSTAVSVESGADFDTYALVYQLAF